MVYYYTEKIWLPVVASACYAYNNKRPAKAAKEPEPATTALAPALDDLAADEDLAADDEAAEDDGLAEEAADEEALAEAEDETALEACDEEAAADEELAADTAEAATNNKATEEVNCMVKGLRMLK